MSIYVHVWCCAEVDLCVYRCHDLRVHVHVVALRNLYSIGRAPVPKGRLLEIIASLQRASENSHQPECQVEALSPDKSRSPSPPPLAPPPAPPTDSPIGVPGGNAELLGTESHEVNGVLLGEGLLDANISVGETPVPSHIDGDSTTAVSEPQASAVPRVESGVPTIPVAPPPPPLTTPMMISRHQPQYQPTVALKPLFWKKLQYSAMEISGRDIVWGNISEPGQTL